MKKFLKYFAVFAIRGKLRQQYNKMADRVFRIIIGWIKKLFKFDIPDITDKKFSLIATIKAAWAM